MNFKDIARMVVRAFRTRDVDEALTSLSEAFWANVGTRGELIDFLAETEKALRERNSLEEAEFCAKLSSAFDAPGKLSYKSFLAEILRVTGWVKIPAPTLYAQEYIERQDARLARASAELVVLAGRQLRRAAARAQEEAREEQRTRLRAIGRRTVFGVASLGLTELMSAALGEDVTDL